MHKYMSLSPVDTKLIQELLTLNNKELEERLATKNDINQIKERLIALEDSFNGIRKELDTEHEVRRQHLEETVKRVEKIEQKLSL